jgi:hypothetical protein
MIERVEWKEGQPVAVFHLRPQAAGRAALGGRADEIRSRWGALPAEYGWRPGFSLHEQVDAASVYGCLLKFKDGGC